MGPFELMDMIGIDVNFAVTQSVCEQFFNDRGTARIRFSVRCRCREAGQENRERILQLFKSSSVSKDQRSVFIVGDDPLVAEYSEIASASGYAIIPSGKINSLKPIAGKVSIALELSNLDLHTKRKNLELLDKALPESTAILSSSLNG